MITNINPAAYKKIMYGHFFHAIFLATIMNTMIRPVRPGGGYGRRFSNTRSVIASEVRAWQSLHKQINDAKFRDCHATLAMTRVVANNLIFM